MAKIAFLGTGQMGQGMAARLLQAGHELTVYNRSSDKTAPLADAGAAVAASPAKAIEGVEVIFAMLADDNASRSVWLGDNGVFAGNPATSALCIECSTLSHDWALELAGEVTSRGHIYIDSPVTGYPHMSADGELVLFVGASDEDLETARPVLAPLCKEIIHFGAIGCGTAYKLMVNLMGAVQIAAAAEGLLIAEKAGLDRKTVARALCMGAAASPQVIRNVQRMTEKNHDRDISFTGQLRLKDTLYGLALADKMGQRAVFGQVAGDAFSRQVEDGLGGLSECKVIDVLRQQERSSDE
jgi:3-hydroxyisobutyrate dehydrogenase